MKRRMKHDRIHDTLMFNCQEFQTILDSMIDFKSVNDGHRRRFIISIGRKAPVINRSQPRLYCVHITYLYDGEAYELLKPSYKALNQNNVDDYVNNLAAFIYEFAEAYADKPLKMFEDEFFEMVRRGDVRKNTEPQIEVLISGLKGRE